MAGILARWRRHWFEPASLTDLGVGRVVLAAIVLWLDGTTRFVGAAVRPGAFWEPIPLLRLVGLDTQPSHATVEWLTTLNLALLVLVLLGVFARPALALLLPLQLYLEALLNCFGKVSHGTIPVLYALLFFLLAPCDRAVALRGPWERGVAGTASERMTPDARWPLELLYVELAAYYTLAGWSKLLDGGVAWADGYTLGYYLLSMGTAPGAWLAQHVGLCVALSWLVLAFELLAPLGIIRRFRPWAIAAAVGFNLGTWIFMNILFWPIPALFLLYVPWTRVGRALAGFARPVHAPVPLT